jgi:hypothetical protein
LSQVFPDPRTFVFFTFFDLVVTTASASLTGCVANRAELPADSIEVLALATSTVAARTRPAIAKADRLAIVASVISFRIVNPPDRSDIIDPAAAGWAAGLDEAEQWASA